MKKESFCVLLAEDVSINDDIKVTDFPLLTVLLTSFDRKSHDLHLYVFFHRLPIILNFDMKNSWILGTGLLLITSCQNRSGVFPLAGDRGWNPCDWGVRPITPIWMKSRWPLAKTFYDIILYDHLKTPKFLFESKALEIAIPFRSMKHPKHRPLK